jgi:hypothetical protein
MQIYNNVFEFFQCQVMMATPLDCRGTMTFPGSPIPTAPSGLVVAGEMAVAVTAPPI